MPGQAAKISTRVCETHGEQRYRGNRCCKCESEKVADWRRKTKRTLVDMFGGKCVRCGYDRSMAALQFHHIDPATKKFGIAAKGHTKALADQIEEAKKCILVCANCHAEIEFPSG
jgi:hypothetical protein